MKIAYHIENPEVRQIIVDRLSDQQLTDLSQLDAQQRLEVIGETDGLVANWLDKEFSTEEKQLMNRPKFVQMLSAGVDHLDFDALPADAPIYSNVGAWADGMSETCLAMTFGLLRRLEQQKHALLNGRFDRYHWDLRSIYEINILIWGWGGIGKACAEKFFKLDVKNISAVGRTTPDDPRLKKAYSFDQLDQALAQCDLLIIAVPATRQTVGAINAQRLALMPKNGMIVNLARAAVIDHDQFLAHLKSNPEFTAAIDVWWHEDHDWNKDDVLNCDQVMGTSHNSQMTGLAWKLAAEAAATNIRKLINGEKAAGALKREDYRS